MRLLPGLVRLWALLAYKVAALRRRPGLALALGLALSTTGCDGVRYVLQQGVGQLELLRARRPVDEVLADPATSPFIRRRLQLALLARSFGITELGLRGEGEFTRFVDTGGAVAWNLTVAYQTKLEIRQYSFPLVGRIAYLGYFRRADALAEMRKLAQAGFDTYLRPVGAFSSVGYFLTPIYSDMISDTGPRGDYDTVETILHEMAHTTAYVTSDSSLNESFATLVGHRGAELFFKRYGPLLGIYGLTKLAVQATAGSLAPDLNQQARATSDDAAKLGAWLRRTMTALRAMYAQAATQGWSKDEILRRREPVFRAASADYVATFPDRAGSRLARGPLDNALLLSLEVYYGPNAKPAAGDEDEAAAGGKTRRRRPRLSQRDLLDLVGGDVRAYINLYREASRRPDGAEWLREQAAAYHLESAARRSAASRALQATRDADAKPAAPPRDAVF